MSWLIIQNLVVFICFKKLFKVSKDSAVFLAFPTNFLQNRLIQVACQAVESLDFKSPRNSNAKVKFMRFPKPNMF